MNETCKLLIKSFYEDEWIKGGGCSYTVWIREKDGLELWGSNGVWHFTGNDNGIHIPLYMRPYMFGQLRKGQNLLATKKLLKGEK